MIQGEYHSIALRMIANCSRRDDVIASLGNGRDRHELRGLAAGSCNSGCSTFQCGDALFKDILHEELVSHPTVKYQAQVTYDCGVAETRVDVSQCPVQNMVSTPVISDKARKSLTSIQTDRHHAASR